MHTHFCRLYGCVVLGVMWNERNNRVFKAKEITTHQMLDKIKFLSLWWLKAYNVKSWLKFSHVLVELFCLHEYRLALLFSY
jgi:hypothetical protein